MSTQSPSAPSVAGIGEVTAQLTDAAHEVSALGRQVIADVKPKLRGWLHAALVPVTLVAGLALVVLSRTATARIGSAVFVGSALTLFTVSAAMHRGRWSPRTGLLLRRLDHASIFLLIAGSYTPFTLLLLSGAQRVTLLVIRHRLDALDERARQGPRTLAAWGDDRALGQGARRGRGRRSRGTTGIRCRLIDLAYPFEGRWLTQNSPADRVPSHGTALFATSYAIDFVPVDEAGRTAPLTFWTLLRTEPLSRFPGFGRPVLAPVRGVVVAVHDSAEDHRAFRGLPSVGYALTQRRRAAAGWPALAGNHVMVETHDGPVVALCHLQRGSVQVRVGQGVAVGERLGRCGNSGNSTEPHVHVQAIDGRDVLHASPVPITFGGRLPRNGEIVAG